MELPMGFGFYACEYEPFERCLRRTDRFSRNSCNTIFARDAAALTERAKCGPVYLIRKCKI